MNRLEHAIKNIFRINLAVKKKEKVLIIFDKNKKNLADLFFNIGQGFTDYINIVNIPIGKVHGEEPPSDVAKKMLNYDVEIIVTTKSLTHTKARKNACKKGARIATLPDASEDMLKRAINVDYENMHKRIAKISDVLDKGKRIKVLSRKGTNLEFSIKGRKAHGRTSGIFTERGRYGNLPDGESFIAPVEGSAKGILIIDGSIGGIGKTDKPVRIFVEGGYAKEIIGGKTAKKLIEQLDNAGMEGKNIAEFGIGMNDKAKITGNMLEDEKVMGTCHIALGSNTGFGGKVDVPLHLDGVISKPSVFIDDKKIMEEGKLLL